MSEPNYFVYILYCPETELVYVGQTDNIILRYYRHRDKRSHWTSRMESPILVHCEGFETRSEAMKREKYYKSGRGVQKKRSIVDSLLKNFPKNDSK